MRKLPLLLALLLLLSVPAAAFSDVPEDHWAAGAIEELASIHVTTGYPDDTFRPGDTLSRAQFLSMVVRICADESVPLAEDGQDWWQPYVDTAAELGILEDGLFPAGTDFQAAIPREEMAQLLLSADRCLGLADGATADLTSAADFSDLTEDPSGAVAWSTATGLLTGYPDGAFRPDKTVTRAEACVVLQRLLRHKGLMEKDEILVFADGTYLVKYAQPERGACTLTSVRLSDGEIVDTATVSRETYTAPDGTRNTNAPRPMRSSGDGFFWGYGGLWQVDDEGQLLCWTELPVIDCALLPDGGVAAILCDAGTRPVTEDGVPCGVRVVQFFENGFSAPLTSGDTNDLTAVEAVGGGLFVTAGGVRCILTAGQLLPAEHAEKG